MAEDYTIVAGHIKEKKEPTTGKTGGVDTVIHKQEMYGAGDMKANQTMLEELKASKEED